MEYKPDKNDIHYRFDGEWSVGLLCKLGYFPNHKVTKDKSKITCPYCQTVILLEETDSDRVTLH